MHARKATEGSGHSDSRVDDDQSWGPLNGSSRWAALLCVRTGGDETPVGLLLARLAG